MNNGGDVYVRRGSVWWVSVDDSVGSEIQTGRPALVISGDKRNTQSNTVVVAYITSTPVGTQSSHRIGVFLGGERKTVVCDQIRSVDKSRLTRYVGFLSADDMKRVTGALATVVCIPINAPTVAGSVEEITKLKVDLAVMTGLYQEALRRLVEKQVATDIDVMSSEEETELCEDVVTEEESEEEPFDVDDVSKVDINTCTEEELRKRGCSYELIQQIVSHRPYKSIDELKALSSMTRVGFQILQNKVCCIPVPVEPEPKVKPKVEPTIVEEEPVDKVNINTCSGKELVEALGCSRAYGSYIESYRKKNGNFVCLEELEDVKYLPKSFLEKFGDRLTCGEEPRDEEPIGEESSSTESKATEPSGEEPRLNINTASLRDFMAVGFGKRVAALIVSERRRFGDFRSVEDLLEIPGVMQKKLRKLRDVLYVGEGLAQSYWTPPHLSSEV